MSAPWPYDDEDPLAEATEPTWACPGGTCDCHAPDEPVEKAPFSVLLRDHNGEVMPGARCRIIVNGRVVNDDKPYAGGDGRIEIEIARRPRMARVEWAPADTPLAPHYPYRKRYYVDLAETSAEEAARRRLANLGFDHYRTLRANIMEFQRELGYPEATGDLEDIELDLCRYHDEGTVPSPPPARTANDDGGEV